MRGIVRQSVFAGIIGGVVLGAVDSNSLVLDVGGFWVGLYRVAFPLMLYAVLGAVFGALAGWVWALVRKPPKENDTAVFRGFVLLFVFVLLALFTCFYLFDLGLGPRQRAAPWQYFVAVLASFVAALLVWQVITLFLRLYAGRSRRLSWVAVTLIAVALLETFAVRAMRPGTSARAEESTAPVPNILLLVMDTTRFDALSCDGNPRPTTRNLDRLAAEGLLFTRAYATASWTPPSHATMFSGLYPSANGTFSTQIHLQGGFSTIAEVLSRAGYETFFLSYKGVLRKAFGWSRGFDHSVTVNVEDKASLLYERLLDVFIKKTRSQTPVTIDIAIRWLESRRSSRPYFLFVNVSDPHTEYVPREPFFTECSNDLDHSKIDEDKVRRVVASQNSLRLYTTGKIHLNTAELEYVRCLYDSEAYYMDRFIGKLFDRIRSLEEGRKTVALITADHGELLGEHGIMGHGDYVYEELIHVPLIVWGTAETGVVDAPVSLLDLFPTILDLAGIESQRDLAGVSLLEPRAGRMVFAESWSGDLSRRAVIDAPFKYVWESTREQYLFDLAKDPSENDNQADVASETARVLHQDLAATFNLSIGEVDTTTIDENALKVLRSLGYVR